MAVPRTTRKERVRFTAWFSRRERDAISAKADQLDSSDNYIVRLAVRQFLGLVNPVTPTVPPEPDVTI